MVSMPFPPLKSMSGCRHLSLMLPGKDGYDICREIRQVSAVPLLFDCKVDARKSGWSRIGADGISLNLLNRVNSWQVQAVMRRTDHEAMVDEEHSGSNILVLSWINLMSVRSMDKKWICHLRIRTLFLASSPPRLHP